MRKLTKVLATVLGLLGLAVVASGGWVWLQLESSLPDYRGEQTLAGLLAPVTVERDALGVVTIRSTSRLDEARALGFVHAQERFFQMDLLRRSGAGELAALVGPGAIDADRRARRHQLRQTARTALSESPPETRALFEAYAAGVNAGLKALGAHPFEYLLLRQPPEPWRAEDSILTVAAMYFTLQDQSGFRKRNEITARSVLPAAFAEFIYSTETPWDAPLVGPPGPPLSPPPAAIYDLRRLPPELFAQDLGSSPVDDTAANGSNNWALSGQRTATGVPLVAGDPHLNLQAPSIWFRVSLERDGRSITGASLPGLPLIAFGSNGDVAWALTNSYGDWTDLVRLELDPANASRYRTPDGWREIERIGSPIAVAGGEIVEYTIEQTIFGPIVATLPDGSPVAVRWVAHDPRGLAPAYVDLNEVTTVDDALSAAQRSGIPAQNFVVADRAGNIAWTIIGPIPRRDRQGRISASRQGSAWSGWLAPDEYPRVVNPGEGAVWTANGRVVDGEMLAAVGDGYYDLGARASQIRDRLAELERATEADMLAIQLDDEAMFLDSWRTELLDALEGSADDNALLAAARDAVVNWGGHAAVDSVGYRLVAGWRGFMTTRIATMVVAPVLAVDPTWNYPGYRVDTWVLPILHQQPLHLLEPGYASWHELERDVFDDYLQETLAITDASDLAGRDWGDFNTVRVQHPLSRAVPLLSRWLDTTPRELPGDNLMPRVQRPSFGASARFAVSPGLESQGYFHMPGGQSGHPLSPYYGAGHDDWAEGKPTPFLPGPAEQTLRLVP